VVTVPVFSGRWSGETGTGTGGAPVVAQIGRELGVSTKTVRNHASNIFAKLQVAHRAQAIVLAREAGLE